MRTAWTLLAATFAVACTKHGGLDRSVSHGQPTTVGVGDVPVKGFPVEVETAGRTVSGELLAVDARGIFVLTDDGTRLVPAGEVKKVSVELYGTGGATALMAVWTVLGTASTLTHGFYLVITAPAWLVTGVPTAVATGASGDLDVPADKDAYLWQFARFPAGLPESWRDRGAGERNSDRKR